MTSLINIRIWVSPSRRKTSLEVKHPVLILSNHHSKSKDVSYSSVVAFHTKNIIDTAITFFLQHHYTVYTITVTLSSCVYNTSHVTTGSGTFSKGCQMAFKENVAIICLR